MKKPILYIITAFAMTVVFSCGGGDKKTEEKEQKMVEEQVKSDQQKMDSLEKAIKAQIDSVSDDSLMKAEH